MIGFPLDFQCGLLRQPARQPARTTPFFLALMLALFSSATAGQIRNLHVVTTKSAFQIRGFLQDSETYASVADIAARLAFPVAVDESRGKLELRAGDCRLKLTARNPFIVVIDHASNTIGKIVQMPRNVLRTQDGFFVPIHAFAPVLSDAWRHAVAVDVSASEILIDGAASRIVPDAGPAPEPVAPARQTADSVASGAPKSSGKTEAAEQDDRLAPREIAPEKEITADITHVTVDARQNGTLVRIHSRKPLFGFTDTVTAERRLELLLPGVTADEDEIRQTPICGVDVTAVSAVREDKAARIVIDLGEHVQKHAITKDAAGDDLLVSIFHDAEVEKIYLEEQQSKKKKSETKRGNWSLDCVVIDAGHGGGDPGAIGINGNKEKHMNLGIALKLGELIEDNLKNVRVVYTRKDDRFIELDRRGRIANEAEGKLFISIHCNSTEKKPTTAHGAEVYLLRPGRTEEAIRIAEFENSVIKLEKDYEKRYQKLTSENFILITMAQSAYAKYSERFAELFHEEVAAGKKLKSLGVKQAGFYVLVGASMPGVLIESGFLSNPREEAFLATQAGQNHVARMIFEAIETFAKEYDRSLKE
jgi:N-acetylmuramoyl-L-alanine amidase